MLSRFFSDSYVADVYKGLLLFQKIKFAINNLSTSSRAVIVLRDIEKLSYSQISSIIDVPIGTVKSRINRARIQLQLELKDFRK